MITSLIGAQNPHVLRVHPGFCVPFASYSRHSRQFIEVPLKVTLKVTVTPDVKFLPGITVIFAVSYKHPEHKTTKIREFFSVFYITIVIVRLSA